MVDQFLEEYIKQDNQIEFVIKSASNDTSLKNKILKYLLEGPQNQEKFKSAQKIFICGLNNNFITKNDISLKNIEKKLLFSFEECKNDSEMLELMSFIISKIYSLLIKQESFITDKQFSYFLKVFQAYFENPTHQILGIHLLKQLLVNWPNFYQLFQQKTLKFIEICLQNQATIQTSLQTAFQIIQQTEQSALKDFSQILPLVISAFYDNCHLLDFDTIESFQDSIVQCSIIFRKYYQLIQERTFACVQNEEINSENQMEVIKCFLLLFDKQIDFFQKDSLKIGSIFQLIFDFAISENISEGILLENNGKFVNNKMLSKNNFCLKQLRDLSKILNFEQVGTVYEEIVSKAISSKEPKRVFCAFILYSTIGEYQLKEDYLNNFIKTCVDFLKQNTNSDIEKYAVLNCFSFFSDFLEHSFTNIYFKSVFQECLIVLISQNNTSSLIKSQIYQTITLFLANLQSKIDKNDIKLIVKNTLNDIKSQEDYLIFHGVALVDFLCEKFKEDIKVFAENFYFSLKKINAANNIDLFGLLQETKANFIKNFPEIISIQEDLSHLLQQPNIQNYKQISIQLNVLHKLSFAIEKQGKILQNINPLIEQIVLLLQKAIQILIDKSEQNIEDIIDAPRKGFQCLQLIFEKHPEYSILSCKVLQICIDVLNELNDHLNIRDSALELVPSVIKCMKIKNEEGIKENMHELTKVIIKNMQSETENQCLLEYIEVFYKCLSEVGNCFDDEIIKNMLIFFFQICEEQNDDKIKQDSDKISQLEVCQAAGSLIELIYQTHLEEAYLCFDEIVCDKIMAMCDNSQDQEIKLVGYNVLVNIMCVLGYDKIKDYIEDYLAYLLEGIEEELYGLKQTSVYGLGLLCQITPKKQFKEHKVTILNAIMSCVCHEAEDIEEMDEDEENEVGLFTDNAISALLKITYYQNCTEEVGPLLDLIPLQYDKDEAIQCNNIFCNLLLEKKIDLKVHCQEIQKAIKLISESEFVNEEINGKIKQINQLQFV